jgi:serine/threonine-protein kinase
MKICQKCGANFEDTVSFCPHDGEVLEDDPSTLVGKVLDGQYRIDALLGKGGMGAVYRAQHIMLGDTVAIKVLPPQMRTNTEWLRRFQREGQAARRFRHHNAVTVYDLRTTADGLVYMVMEYVAGHTLDAELKERGRFTPADAYATLEPVMSVLDAAHAMGVVHRDLKPENIMIGKGVEGRTTVKLLDLGIAKMREAASAGTGKDATALTMAGQILGTPYYMSPEQWGEVPRDDSSEIDGRADLYSLGTVFYELLAGRRPYGGNTLPEIRREHVQVTPPPLHELMPEIPQAFSLAIAHAMAKDRDDRPATAAEMAQELRAALDSSELRDTAILNAGAPNNAQLTASRFNASGNQTPSPSNTSNADARNTNSDLNAPTIMTLDAAATSAPNSSAALAETTLTSPAQVPTPNAKAPMPNANVAAPSPKAQVNSFADNRPETETELTVRQPRAAHLAELSPLPLSDRSASNTPPQSLPAPVYAETVPQRRSSVVPFAFGALVLLLVVGAVGVLLFWRGSGARTVKNQNQTVAPKVVEKNVPPNVPPTTGAVEAITYWLEIEDATKNNSSTLVTGEHPLASGQSFKFHFTPHEDGYLYIIGPGEKNAPTTFLTDKPVPASGLSSNQIKGGAEVVFPNGAENWLTLDKTSGKDNFTIIYSPTPITALAFLYEAAGHPLTQDERESFDSFRGLYKANAPSARVYKRSNDAPQVSLQLQPSESFDNPLIFDIGIEHK